MNKLFFYLFFLLSLSFYGQNNEAVYYDSNWSLCQKKEAKYYRIYNSYDKDSKTWEIKTYYINGTIQWIGRVKNNDPKATKCSSAQCHGIATWFNENGNKSSERTYMNGVLNGTALSYNDKGVITLSLNFINGKILKKPTSKPIYIKNNSTNNRSKYYSYSVSGYGNDNSVYGDISVNKNGGSGTIYDENDNEISIDLEWTGKGTLEGYDEDGNYYELEVE
jgi:antitoxin component YwqK of YwqJK toxin-antitoxin module